MTRLPMLILPIALGTAPAAFAEPNMMKQMDENYVQLVQDGWEELGGMASNESILLGKDTRRAVCELRHAGRLIYHARRPEEEQEKEYTLECFEFATKGG